MVVAMKYAQAIATVEAIPATLRETRRTRGLSLREVGRQTKLSADTIQRVERGEGCTLTHAMAIMRWIDGR